MDVNMASCVTHSNTTSLKFDCPVSRSLSVPVSEVNVNDQRSECQGN